MWVEERKEGGQEGIKEDLLKILFELNIPKKRLINLKNVEVIKKDTLNKADF